MYNDLFVLFDAFHLAETMALYFGCSLTHFFILVFLPLALQYCHCFAITKGQHYGGDFEQLAQSFPIPIVLRSYLTASSFVSFLTIYPPWCITAHSTA